MLMGLIEFVFCFIFQCYFFSSESSILEIRGPPIIAFKVQNSDFQPRLSLILLWPA